MEDRIDAFARLKRLHIEGVLSEKEYEREKAKLMGHDPAGEKSSWTGRWAIGRAFGKGVRGSMLPWFIGSVVLVLVIGTYFFGKAASLAEARGELAGSAGGSDGAGPAASSDEGAGWIVGNSTDPMTDVSVAQAALGVAGQQYDAEVTVACGSDGNITYTAASFDKDRQPAEMRMREVPFGSLAGTWIDYQMRADDRPARSLSTFNSAYNNQVVLKTDAVQPLYEDGSGIDDAEQMASASRVVVRLLMTSGEETFELPQADAAFRNVVQPCLAQRQAKRQQLTAARREGEAQTRAGQEAYIDRLYDDAAVDADTLVWLANNRNVPVDEARLAQKRAREAGKPRPAESPNVVSGM